MNNEMWIAFMLRDKYVGKVQKQNLKKDIMVKFNRKSEDICYLSNDEPDGTSYYFFVKEYDKDNDLRTIHQNYINMFESFYYHTRISKKQLDDMIDSYASYNEVIIKFGDIVRINSGCYKKLYGIVLRQNRNNKFDVGLKFCFGTLVKSYDKSDLTVTGNIFNYIKVLH